MVITQGIPHVLDDRIILGSQQIRNLQAAELFGHFPFPGLPDLLRNAAGRLLQAVPGPVMLTEIRSGQHQGQQDDERCD